MGWRPREEGSDRLLRKGTTLDLSELNPAAGLDLLTRHLEGWTPQVAPEIQRGALRRLDWRSRMRSVAEILGAGTSTLDTENKRAREARATFKE